ncbi:MAG: hypothetical protein FDX21_02820 [Chlorobium sp.]|nr:MAG: hypothetical protein FDX21_02820 [Chlorobium sp.]
MKIRKAILAVACALMFGAGTSYAAVQQAPNAGKFGLGYQGVFGGSILQGLSARYLVNNNVGTELNLYYGNASIDAGGSSNLFDGDLLLATAKVMYAPVVNAHSRFYFGLEGGIGSVGLKQSGVDIPGDVSVYVINPFIGSEFNFSEIPELGFNFEVGYKIHNVTYSPDGAPTDLQINLDGTFVSVGAHYYF